MSNTNPFLGDAYLELVAKDGSSAFIPSEQAANESSSAVEELENQVDEAHHQSISEADLGLKTVVGEDVRMQQVSSYKAALQHFPVKSTMGVQRLGSSLPVFDPESPKDHATVAFSSTSRAFPYNNLPEGSYAADFTSNSKPSSSHKEEHLREDTSVHISDDGAEDQPNETFRLCFVAPKSISECKAFVKYEVIVFQHSLNLLASIVASYELVSKPKVFQPSGSAESLSINHHVFKRVSLCCFITCASLIMLMILGSGQRRSGTV